MDDIVNSFIRDYDRCLARINERNKGEFLEVKTLTFTIILMHQNDIFTYVDQNNILVTIRGKETMINVKKDLARLLKRVKETGYKLKCIRNNGNFLCMDFKKSVFYNLAVLIDRYIC